jgi:hypothetical protein
MQHTYARRHTHLTNAFSHAQARLITLLARRRARSTDSERVEHLGVQRGVAREER